MRLILREYDLHRGEVQFAAKVLQALALNSLDELVRWAQTADKMEIAMLTPTVFEAAVAGDERVIEILEEGARVLSEYTEAVASRLHLLAPKVMLLGGLFHRDSIYAHTFRRRLKKNLPDVRVAVVEQSPELGAAWLAAEMPEISSVRLKLADEEVENLAAALTEQRNPRSENLEKMGARELVELFVKEEKYVEGSARRRDRRPWSKPSASQPNLCVMADICSTSVRGAVGGWEFWMRARFLRPLGPRRIWSRELSPEASPPFTGAWKERRTSRAPAPWPSTDAG